MIRACPQCKRETDQVQCPHCRHFLTEDPEEAYRVTVDPPIPDRLLKWGTTLGAWGDAFAALGRIRQVLTAQGLDGCGIVHYGEDPAIPAFLYAQSWIHHVIAIRAPDRTTYLRRNGLACSGRHDLEDWLPQAALEDPGGAVRLPELADVQATHTTNEWMHSYRPQILDRAELPTAVRQAAASTRRGIASKPGQRVFLVHPSSTQSSPADWHWPHWRAAVAWLLTRTPHVYVLTGLADTIGIEHPRLVNLAGKLPTNLECLALLDLCDGLISTNNNLALWTVTRRRPRALIMATLSMRNLVDYYRRYIQRPPNTFLHCSTTFPEWETAATRWMEAA